MLRFVALVLFLLFSTSSASAQSRSANALVERGLTLRQRHRDEEALALFEQAYQMEPAPRTAAQIGLAEHALRRYVRAREKLTEALASSSDTWVRSRASVLLEALADTENHLGRVTVDGCEPGVEVIVDDRRVAVCPMTGPAFLEPGDKTLVFKLDSETVGEASVEVRAGEVSSVVVTLRRPRAEVVATAPPSEPPAAVLTDSSPPEPSGGPSPSWRGPVGWTAVGLGAAGLAVGIAAHVLREGDATYYNDNCVAGDPSMRPSDCMSRRSRGEGTYTSMMVAGYVAGGVLVAAGAVLLLLPREQSESPAEAILSCAPSFIGGVSVACSGRF